MSTDYKITRLPASVEEIPGSAMWTTHFTVPDGQELVEVCGWDRSVENPSRGTVDVVLRKQPERESLRGRVAVAPPGSVLKDLMEPAAPAEEPDGRCISSSWRGQSHRPYGPGGWNRCVRTAVHAPEPGLEPGEHIDDFGNVWVVPGRIIRHDTPRHLRDTTGEPE